MAKQVSKRLILNSLLIILFAMLVYFIGYQPNFKQPADRAMGQSNALFTIASYQANHIKIIRVGEQSIELTKKADDWQLTQPALAPLNKNRIKHLLTILEEPIVASYKVAGKDLKTFGLTPGKVELIIASKDKTESLIFGKTNAVTLNRYVLKNNEIHTINEIVYGVLGTSITQLLAHHLLPDSVEITKVEAPALLANFPHSFWQNVEAQNIADDNGDDTIIGKVVIEVVEKAETTTELSNIKNESITFNILAIKPALVLSRPDLKVKYTFAEGILSELTQP